jgi:hypothetical protein
MEKKMTKNAVVKKDESQFALMAMNKDQIKELIQTNLAGENIDSVTDLTRVKVPSGGGTTWVVPTIEGEMETKELTGILICHQLVRTYWEVPFESGERTPPDCQSLDCIIGEGNPGGECMECPFAEFGSHQKTDAQACSQYRLMYMILENELIPVVIKVPPTSLKPSKKFLLGLTSRQRDIHAIYTKLTLFKTVSKSGMDYAQIVFESAGAVEHPELTAAYAAQIKPHLIKTMKVYNN